MTPEQEDLIHDCFKDLVQRCDLRRVMEDLSRKDPATREAMRRIRFEEKRFHDHRLILFALLKQESPDVFPKLVASLRSNGFGNVADKLERKIAADKPGKIHRATCFKPADEDAKPVPTEITTSLKPFGEPLKIQVVNSTQFYDDSTHNKTEFYRTRSKNRGRVLIVNNVSFSDGHEERNGAEVDEHNLKILFGQIGFEIDMYRDLSAKEISEKTRKFSQQGFDDNPDICFVIIMSHGNKLNNATYILGADGLWLAEDDVKQQFNNSTCEVYRNKPKILIFHVCRGLGLDEHHHSKMRTQTDGKQRTLDDRRLTSDMLICHPSLAGFQAHRDTVKGCWYIELICSVFMAHAHDTDVESMLKKVDKGLESRMSEVGSQQTSTFENAGFKTCYLHPGIYEENGQLREF